MSRKYSGNDFEKRWVLSCCWNVDNDSADVILMRYFCTGIHRSIIVPDSWTDNREIPVGDS